MRTLLVAINAKYIHSNLAIYSLRAYVKSKGFEVDMAEYTINQQLDSMLRDIYKRKPDFIGFSCYIWNIEFVCKLAKEVKKVLPECHIWLGGPEVSYDVERVFEENESVDGIFIGEGELVFAKILEQYETNKSIAKTPKIFEKLSDIDGVALARPFTVKPQKEYIDMDVLPFPYEGFEDMAHRIIYYESSRGCPYSCSYCLSSVDKRVRYRSLELVKCELKVFIDAKVPQVKFVDRTFNCNRERTREIWQFIRDNDNGITNFHFEVSADIINEEEINLLHSLRPGLVQLEIGVQTTNPQTIDAIHRKMDFEKLSGIVTAINETKNVHQHLDLIAGLPYEDYESFGNSFNDVYRLKPEQLQMGFLKVLKGSYMFYHAQEGNVVYSSFPPYEVLSTKWLSYDEILRLKGIEEMVENYYNSGQFTATLALIERLFKTPFAMFEYLASFYEKRNFFDIGHSRIRRYEILREAMAHLAQEQVDAQDVQDKLSDDDIVNASQLSICQELIDQTMTYDLYVRENMKSRPVFAGDKGEKKHWLHEFYTNEETIRKLLPDYVDYNTKQIERMTDVEFFTIDMKKMLENREIVRRDCTLLFDYKNISKITGHARCVEID